ncbi:hypothetical protein [Phocaeicola abscessus]|uniref:hypothetical protein n=1 Tax=Phocaeicola abscessus TaxID=555313 RepID=UPI0028EC3A34|nr:hypothetical protein [Phocaeicola abscessus]
MELKIYNRSGDLKLTISTSSSSTWNQELMSENVLSLSFTHTSYVSLAVNDYAVLEGIKFSVKKEYKPKQKNRQTYSYSVKLYAPIHDAEQVKYLYLTDGEYNPQFSLDATPREHLQKWVDNMNRISGSPQWSVGDVIVASRKTIDYNNTSCWEALGKMADAFDTEWWADGFVINLSRCEHGERIPLGYLKGLTSLTQTENSDSMKFFTRLIPLGSTRNIDRSRYGFSRLQLPGREKYIDRNTQYGLYEHVEETAFANIFPHYTGAVTSVRSVQKKGNTGKPFIIYYFKDSGMPFDPNGYELPGLKKRVSFQSGDLNGHGSDDNGTYYFEANYDSATEEWEIITLFPDETRQLPGGNLIPRVGDKYIPWNIRMPEAYETQAEQDYLAAVNDYLEKYSEDTSKYGGDTDYIYIEENGIPLAVGQSVRLLGDEYFTNGYRHSRMTKVVRKLDNLNMATIECADSVGKGWKRQVDSGLSQLKYVLERQQENELADILKSWDGREATDYRLMTALRIIREIEKKALSKEKSDRTEHSLGIGQDLTVDGNAYVGKDLTAKKVTSLNAVIKELATIHNLTVEKSADVMHGIIREYLSSNKFVSGFLGEGFKIWQDAVGLWHGELDMLTVRKVFTVFALVVQKVVHQGGMVIRSAAGGKITKVTDGGSFWRCEHDSSDDFVKDDQVLCQVFTGVKIKRYWRLVTSAGASFFNLSKSDCEGGSAVPEVGDEVAVLGNRTNTARQSAQIDCVVGANAPFRDDYAGINSYSLAGKLVTRTGNIAGIVDPDFGALSGFGLYSLNVYLKGMLRLTSGKTVETAIGEARSAAIATAASDAQEKINNLQIGGRNLIRNSSQFRVSGGMSLGSDYIQGQQYTISIEESVNVSPGAQAGKSMLLYCKGASSYPLSLHIPISESKQVVTFIYPVEGRGSLLLCATESWTGVSDITKLKIEIGNKATDWTPAPEDVQTEVDSAKLDAANAQTAATNAQTSANTANSLLADIASDNKLTANEKQETKKDWDSIVSEYQKNITQAGKFSVSTTAYTTAYNALSSYITPLLSNLGTTTDINGATFRATFKAYYDARTDLLNVISAKAKELADAAQTSANTANSLLADIASDNKLTANEKQETKKDWDSIVSEYQKNITQAGKFSVSTTAYTTAYNALSSYITPLLSNLGTTTDINGATFRATFKAYYDARTDLLNVISAKAKELADAAQTAANNAQKEAEKVRTEYKADFVVLSDRIESKVSQSDFNALGQRVSTTESTITQLPNQITLAVQESKNYADNAVNSIQVGGRNLMLNSSQFRIIGGKSVGTNFIPGQQYTISIEKSVNIDSGSQPAKTLLLYCRDITPYPLRVNIPISESKQVATFTYPMTGKGNLVLCATEAWAGTSDITKLKIEQGNKATDWTPAPEDVEADAAAKADAAINAAISDAAAKYTTKTEHSTQLAVLNSSISAKVSQTDFNALSTRMSTAEQKITPDSIKLTVKEQTEQIVDSSVSKINGVNLLLNTALTVDKTGWSTGLNGLKNMQRDPDMTYEGRCSLYISVFGNTKPFYASVQHSNSYLVAREEDTFTASVYARKSSTSSIDKGVLLRIMFYKTDGTYSKYFDKSITPSQNDTWERFTLTATAPAETVRVAYRLTVVQNGGFWVNGMMLVRGAKTTGWSQSPLDCPTTDQIKSEFVLDGNGISLFGKRLSLNGVVTFNSLAADAQEKINAAQSAASSAEAKANTAQSNANAAQQLANTALTQKIGLARLDATIIDGGYIKTTLIHADELIVSHLSAADGTFRNLRCINQQGDTVASLAFSGYGDGCIAVENGDLFMQGYKGDRPLRFYSSDLWCRGVFGSRSRALVEVNGTIAYYYSKGLSGTKVSLPLPQKTYNGETYYVVPCYGSPDLPLGDANGMPVDIIVFTSKVPITYKYDIDLFETQRVLLFNANDNYSIEIYTNGKKKVLSGGEAIFAQNLRRFLYPSPGVNQPGAGIVFCSSYDNDYRQ